ncbi:thyroid receptor-interacting protein 11-like [Notothenia coriiceps]|uniref:Thyroid receptor-interacting protein 11-like n=1 Tax=Notothenia coriiceps TaxID=8208 RepID=A0A6I9NPU9_9TELE|nr:PREDICTED: thyroid receptor-interacting protein 11-like [Notothenia coriiceps]
MSLNVTFLTVFLTSSLFFFVLQHERLRTLHAELEEKLEASEIQIKSQSAEYRSLLQQKDVEIGHLKARQSGLHEEFQTLQKSSQSSSVGPAMLPVSTTSSSTTSSSTTSSSFLSRPSGTHSGFHGDEMDLSEVLWSQQEINRLSNEVLRLESEVTHWRSISQVIMTFSPGPHGDFGVGGVVSACVFYNVSQVMHSTGVQQRGSSCGTVDCVLRSRPCPEDEVILP